MGDNLAAVLRLMLVTDDALLAGRDPVPICQAAVDGGVTIVQLRRKRAPDREVVELATRLVAALPIPVIVNDRVDLALVAQAAGAHLGPDDLSPALARRIVPPGFLIGASVGTADEISRGFTADYWGIGPLRATSTKSDAGPAIGLSGAERLCRAAGDRHCVLIGGVGPEDMAAAFEAGFAGVAVSRGILGDGDVRAAAARFRLAADSNSA
jgi:thiamine-phosphate pyrophosphorylase